jgi:8-oxo-dGTP pyrophosphatase MutT (NUDIX family)
VDSYRYGGRDHDRSAAMEQIIALLVAQGDFFKVNERGGCFVLGRSDATLNRTQWRYTLGRMSVEIPTGGSQSSDHGVLAAAKRELREETGLSAGYWRELGFIDNSNGTTTDVAHMFLATGLEAGTDAQDAEERIVLSWLPFGQAVEKVLDGSITESVSVAAILKANLLLRRER